MELSLLITTVREDYLDDANAPYLWSDGFLLRSFAEAERQACNRSNLLFESGGTYTKIALLNGVSSYKLSGKLTQIERASFTGSKVRHISKEEIDRKIPAWRNQVGIVGNKMEYWVRGRTLTLTRTPFALLDATFVQDSAPTSGMTSGDTWYDSLNSLLYVYSSGVWTLNASAPLGYLLLEAYRLPIETELDASYEPEIPEEHHRDLIWWVLHEAYRKQDADTYNQERSDYFLSRFNEVFGDPVPSDVRAHQFEEPRDMNVGLFERADTFVSSDDW